MIRKLVWCTKEKILDGITQGFIMIIHKHNNFIKKLNLIDSIFLFIFVHPDKIN